MPTPPSATDGAPERSRQVVDPSARRTPKVFFGPARFELTVHLAAPTRKGWPGSKAVVPMSVRDGSTWSANVRVVSRFLPSDRLHDPSHPLLLSSHHPASGGRARLGAGAWARFMLPPPARFVKVSPNAVFKSMRERMRRRRELRAHRMSTSALLDSLQMLRRLTEMHDASVLCANAPSRTRRACARLRQDDDGPGAEELRALCMELTSACEQGRRPPPSSSWKPMGGKPMDTAVPSQINRPAAPSRVPWPMP